MTKKIRCCLFLLVVLAVCSPLSSMAGDLDDGISKFTDGSISKDDQLGQVDKNINFLKVKAKSQGGNTAGGSGGVITGGSGGGNMNSVLVGPGSNIRGDIIIIDDSKGDKTQIVE